MICLSSCHINVIVICKAKKRLVVLSKAEEIYNLPLIWLSNIAVLVQDLLDTGNGMARINGLDESVVGVS